MNRGLRNALAALMLVSAAVLESTAPKNVLAQTPQDCPVEEYIAWQGQTVPPAPAYMDRDGNGTVDGGDVFACSVNRMVYYEFCGYHSPTDAATLPCAGNPPPSPQETILPYIQTPADTALRTGPSANCPMIASMPTNQGAQIEETTRGNEWYRVTYNGQSGWVAGGAVSVVHSDTLWTVPVGSPDGCGSAPDVTHAMLVSTTNLRVRSGPDVCFNQLGMIGPGAWYTIEAKNRDSSWLRIHFNGQTGWVSAQYVNINDPSLMFAVVRISDSAACLEPDITESTDGADEPPSSRAVPAEDAPGVAEAVAGALADVLTGQDFPKRAEAIFVIETAVEVLDEVAGMGNQVQTAITVVCLPVTYVEGFDLLLHLDADQHPVYRAGDHVCTYAAAGASVVFTLLRTGSPLGLVPILLEPGKYVDPWLDPINEWAWSMPLTCTLVPDLEICK